MTRPAVIPVGAWPARMPADMAAGYCGERSAEAFLARVGSEYPQPVVRQHKRTLWLKIDLDKALHQPSASVIPEDAAEVL
ncbi:hypothetical protein [Pannonibacter indicus]|uniref:hypothetical protein n=1 Tax=Pannonibacter indicus TaxID=466044 RepID=UPI00391D11DF